MLEKMKKLPGLKKSRRPAKGTHYWVRKREADLQIGFGHTKKGLSGETWYGILQELGGKNQPKRSILRDTVYENIGLIRQIEAQYLSAIENELKAEQLISEEEQTEDE
jgi:hypothetical protein